MYGRKSRGMPVEVTSSPCLPGVRLGVGKGYCTGSLCNLFIFSNPYHGCFFCLKEPGMLKPEKEAQKPLIKRLCACRGAERVAGFASCRWRFPDPTTLLPLIINLLNLQPDFRPTHRSCGTTMPASSSLCIISTTIDVVLCSTTAFFPLSHLIWDPSRFAGGTMIRQMCHMGGVPSALLVNTIQRGVAIFSLSSLGCLSNFHRVLSSSSPPALFDTATPPLDPRKHGIASHNFALAVFFVGSITVSSPNGF